MVGSFPAPFASVRDAKLVYTAHQSMTSKTSPPDAAASDGLLAGRPAFGGTPLRYSEGRGEFAGTTRPSEYLRACHLPPSSSVLPSVPQVCRPCPSAWSAARSRRRRG